MKNDFPVTSTKMTICPLTAEMQKGRLHRAVVYSQLSVHNGPASHKTSLPLTQQELADQGTVDAEHKSASNWSKRPLPAENCGNRHNSFLKAAEAGASFQAMASFLCMAVHLFGLTVIVLRIVFDPGWL